MQGARCQIKCSVVFGSKEKTQLSVFCCSAHDGDVKLWDSRNDSAPLTYLSAHLSRVPWTHFGIRESIQAPQVHSIDWSYADPHSLVTASNDCTVKFHNVQGKRKDWQLKKQHPRKSHRDTLLFPLHQRSCLEGQVRLMICKKKKRIKVGLICVKTYYFETGSHRLVTEW